MATKRHTGGKRPGSPKTGGRKKGTPNKLSVRTREQLWDYAQSKNVNPFEHAIDVIGGEIDKDYVGVKTALKNLWKDIDSGKAKMEDVQLILETVIPMIETVSLHDILDCAKDLRQYLLPKLKQVEADVNVSGSLDIKVVNYADNHDTV